MKKDRIVFFPEMNMGWVINKGASPEESNAFNDETPYGAMTDVTTRPSEHHYQLSRLLMDILNQI